MPPTTTLTLKNEAYDITREDIQIVIQWLRFWGAPSARHSPRLEEAGLEGLGGARWFCRTMSVEEAREATSAGYGAP